MEFGIFSQMHVPVDESEHKTWQALGADQLIFSPLTMVMDQKHVLRSIETFGKHIISTFDTDPQHSTTRQRLAALAARAA